MKLEEIGFYTLSDARVKQAGINSPLWRCELLLGARCNFKCPYCRNVGGKDLPYEQAITIVREWGLQGLKNIRFSGGEPTLWPGLVNLVTFAATQCIERIAISTNGSASADLYRQLVKAGANDFSVSLDACCAEDGDKMAGGVKGAWDVVVANIRELSMLTYTTVGIVLTEQNASKTNDIIRLAHDLGVSDIRVIPAAQNGSWLESVRVDADLLKAHPVLKYRIKNMMTGTPVRGLRETDSRRCGLVTDDMATMDDKHYPCIIYLREGGNHIGTIGPEMRRTRVQWAQDHATHIDPICSRNCLDVCRDYNNQFAAYSRRTHERNQ